MNYPNQPFLHQQQMTSLIDPTQSSLSLADNMIFPSPVCQAQYQNCHGNNSSIDLIYQSQMAFLPEQLHQQQRVQCNSNGIFVKGFYQQQHDVVPTPAKVLSQCNEKDFTMMHQEDHSIPIGVSSASSCCGHQGIKNLGLADLFLKAPLPTSGHGLTKLQPRIPQSQHEGLDRQEMSAVQRRRGPSASARNEKPIELPANYEPTGLDVLCGRHKSAFDHPGNVRFRNIVQGYLPRYKTAPTRLDRSILIIEIVEDICDSGGYFLKHREEIASSTTKKRQKTKDSVGDTNTKDMNTDKSRESSSSSSSSTADSSCWVIISDKEKRNKVGHALRDASRAASNNQERALSRQGTTPYTREGSSSKSKVTIQQRRISMISSSCSSPVPGTVGAALTASATISTAAPCGGAKHIVPCVSATTSVMSSPEDAADDDISVLSVMGPMGDDLLRMPLPIEGSDLFESSFDPFDDENFGTDDNEEEPPSRASSFNDHHHPPSFYQLHQERH